MHFALLVLLCSTANLSFRQDSQIASSMPSFNYWDLSAQLLRSLSLQKQLNVSSEERSRLVKVVDLERTSCFSQTTTIATFENSGHE